MGSIASRLDPRLPSSDVSTGGGRNHRVKVEERINREEESGRRKTIHSNSTSGSSSCRRTESQPPSKERRQLDTLIQENPSPNSGTSHFVDGRMKLERPSNHSRKGRSTSLSSDISRSGKTEKVNNFATQARSLNEEHQCRPRHHREALQSIQSNSKGSASAQRLQKKLRPTSHRTSGGSTIRKGLQNDAARADDNPGKERPNTCKVSVDPPGAVLGALPWIPSGEGFAMVAEHAHTGCRQPSHHPMNAHWGIPPNVTNVNWTLPPFLAPFAATVRHPLTMFMTHSGVQQNITFPHYRNNCPSDSNQHCLPIEMEDGSTTFCSDFNAISTEDNFAASMDEDTKVATASDGLPSTFAPIKYIENIRARRMCNRCSSQAVGKETKYSSKSLPERVITRSAAKAEQHAVSGAVDRQSSSPVVSRTNDSSSQATSSNLLESSPAEILTVLGKRVTMIDSARKVFIVDLLSSKTCDEIRTMADSHTIRMHESGSNAEVWRTLYTYTKMDLPVCEVDYMREKYTDPIQHDIKRIVGEIFGMRKEAMSLRPRSWKEPHLLLYQALDDKPHHTGIEMHYDGCDITWQAMLTHNDEYEGGGTYFRCLRKTVVLKQGQVLVHPGELYHKGLDIAYGVRCLLVCFTDGMSPKIMDDSKQDEDDPAYEKNVCIY